MNIENGDPTNWEQGEFIDSIIKKKKITLLRNNKEIDLKETIEEINKKLEDYKGDRFSELDRTLLPLSKYCTTHPVELVGFILGFIAGSKFERENIRIKVEEIEPTEEEKKYYNEIKLHLYDFGLDPK